MKQDFKNWVLYLAFGMPLLFLAFIAGLYFIPCGFTNNCSQATLPEIIHTPIPTLRSATLPVPLIEEQSSAGAKCAIQAMSLLEAWVNSGYSETIAFNFIDSNGANCEANFLDVQVLFNEGNLWYNGAPACTTCHNSNIAAASAQMDLSSYDGILAGSRRSSNDAKGNDILGNGIWLQSKLHEVLNLPSGEKLAMPLGRPPDAIPPGGPTILTGSQIPNP